jgi:hypothetical protein
MISSIFGKTKPINFIILSVFLFLYYWVVQVYLFKNDLSVNQVVLETGVLSILLFSVFVVDFIAKRNKLTESNSYAILFYVLLFVVFPETLTDTNAILCSLLLLLATRRLLSIKSLKDVKSKVFDATLWILTSSLFYDWALIYLLLVFVAIYIYEPKNSRNWFVVLSAAFAFFMISYTVLMLVGIPNFLWEHYNFRIDFAAIYPFNWGASIKISVYIIINLLLALWAFLALGKSGTGKIITVRIIALSFVLGLLVNVLVLSESTYAIIITFFPCVIFICNYIDAIKRRNVLELLLIVCTVVPLLVFLGRLWVA